MHAQKNTFARRHNKHATCVPIFCVILLTQAVVSLGSCFHGLLKSGGYELNLFSQSAPKYACTNQSARRVTQLSGNNIGELDLAPPKLHI